MLQIHRVSPHLIEITASGQLITADVEQALPQILEVVSEQGVKIRALLDLTRLEGWSGVQIPASLYDLQPRMLSNMLERIAVVAAGGQLQHDIERAARYLPAAEVRIFAPEEDVQARQWVGEK